LDQASSGAAVKDARFIRAESAVVTPDGWGREGQTPVSVSDLRFSICEISSDHLQIVAGGFERLSITCASTGVPKTPTLSMAWPEIKTSPQLGGAPRGVDHRTALEDNTVHVNLIPI